MLLLIDENVPDSVSQVFRNHGHEVYLVRDVLGGGTPDAVIARAGNALEAIVVTWNVRHFRKLASRGGSDQPHLGRLGYIYFTCSESKGAMKAEQMMSRIEFEFQEAKKHPDKRVTIRISETSYTVTV